MSSSSRSSPVAPRSNLHSFLHSVTPTVPSRSVNKSRIDATTKLHTLTDEAVETFTLADLWEVLDEWSAYGRGVPVVSENGDVAVQYYEPYLSSLQIYTNEPAHLIRGPGGELDELLSVGSGSDDLSRASSDSRNGWDDMSSDSSNEGGAPLARPLDYLYFEYFEKRSPRTRVPLVDKIAEFAPTFPGLCNLRTVDLAPASWMSVAWCPINLIPVKGRIIDLSTCFLSFYTLSSAFQEPDLEEEGDNMVVQPGFTTLSPFGLSTYKLDGRFWLNGANDRLEAVKLYSAADSWLRQLEVTQHYDFNYFASCSPLAVCYRISAP